MSLLAFIQCFNTQRIFPQGITKQDRYVDAENTGITFVQFWERFKACRLPGLV